MKKGIKKGYLARPAWLNKYDQDPKDGIYFLLLLK